MPVEDVEQAVFESKFSSAEADVAEVVARMLEVPRDLVVRVRAALTIAEDIHHGGLPSLEELDEKLRRAYRLTIRRGIARMRIRSFIQNGEETQVRLKALITKPVHVCRGCPNEIECSVHSRATPQECFDRGPVVSFDPCKYAPGTFEAKRGYPTGYVYALPVKIKNDKVTVECRHPQGTYVIDVWDAVPP